jgi:cytochrome c
MGQLAATGAVAAVLCGSGTALAGGDPDRGQVVFEKCYACHSIVPGETGLTGPNLYGVVGRPVASEPGFAYSEALEALPKRGYPVWTPAALDAFTESPERIAPGTAMTFVGLASAQERADLIAYLADLPAEEGARVLE